MDAGNLEGLIPFLGGIYMIYLLNRKLPEEPEKAEAIKKWREKFGPFLTYIAPLVILFGIALLAGIL